MRFLAAISSALALLSTVFAALAPTCEDCGAGSAHPCGDPVKALHMFDINRNTSMASMEQTTWSFQGVQAGEVIKVTKLHKVGTAYTAISVNKPDTRQPYALDVVIDGITADRLRVKGNCIKMYKDKVVEGFVMELP